MAKNVILQERDGKIVLGTLVFDSMTATRLATAMENLARWSVSKASGDPDRDTCLTFPIHKIIDPLGPVTEVGGIAPPDEERPR